jgi:hypothetical protein
MPTASARQPILAKVSPEQLAVIAPTARLELHSGDFLANADLVNFRDTLALAVLAVLPAELQGDLRVLGAFKTPRGSKLVLEVPKSRVPAHLACFAAASTIQLAGHQLTVVAEGMVLWHMRAVSLPDGWRSGDLVKTLSAVKQLEGLTVCKHSDVLLAGGIPRAGVMEMLVLGPRAVLTALSQDGLHLSMAGRLHLVRFHHLPAPGLAPRAAASACAQPAGRATSSCSGTSAGTSAGAAASNWRRPVPSAAGACDNPLFEDEHAAPPPATAALSPPSPPPPPRLVCSYEEHFSVSGSVAIGPPSASAGPAPPQRKRGPEASASSAAARSAPRSRQGPPGRSAADTATGPLAPSRPAHGPPPAGTPAPAPARGPLPSTSSSGSAPARGRMPASAAGVLSSPAAPAGVLPPPPLSAAPASSSRAPSQQPDPLPPEPPVDPDAAGGAALQWVQQLEAWALARGPEAAWYPGMEAVLCRLERGSAFPGRHLLWVVSLVESVVARGTGPAPIRVLRCADALLDVIRPPDLV